MVLISILGSIAFVVTIAAAPLSSSGISIDSATVEEYSQKSAVDGRSIRFRHVENHASSRRNASPNASSKGHRSKVGTGNGSQNLKSHASNAKAIYFITNSQQNSIVSLRVSANGTLSDGSITPTGGCGLSGVDSAGLPAAPDSLFSQSALKVSGNTLIAVNPGSNTMSMFSISPSDPSQLTMVGKPVNTLGEFPVSVAISSKLSQACVANSGAKAGVACFSICPTSGLSPIDTALRPFQLNQTTPPAGPLNTVSQIFFNEDSSALLTTVKGDPTKNNTGFLSIFPVANNAISNVESRSSPPGTAVLFGTALLPNSSLFVTDASFGSAVLSTDLKTVSSSTNIAGQKATCWATFSTFSKTAFVTDVANNRLVEVGVSAGDIVSEVQGGDGNPGMVDLVSKGRFVYALSPGNGTTPAAIAVFQLSNGSAPKLVQNFNMKGGVSSAQGMAVV